MYLIVLGMPIPLYHCSALDKGGQCGGTHRNVLSPEAVTNGRGAIRGRHKEEGGRPVKSQRSQNTMHKLPASPEETHLSWVKFFFSPSTSTERTRKGT